jgi:hypothetical protein
VPGRWTWTDAAIFIAVISALQLAMFLLLTKVFLGMITEGDRCPVCDGETDAVERQGWWRLISLGPRNRRSWCLSCGWEGLLRRVGRPRPRTSARLASGGARQARASMTYSCSHSGQLPLSSKKSS